jgi:DNA end-binding protein Ku
VLLREALKRAKKVGIAKFVFKDKEHIGLVKPEGNALDAHPASL